MEGILEKVHIEYYGSNKFVLIEGPNKGYYLFAGHSDHRTLFNVFLKRNQSVLPQSFHPRGGGSVLIDERNKLVYAMGDSTFYGKFEVAPVKSLLEKWIEEIGLRGYSLLVE